MTLRIAGGLFRGRVLKTPNNERTRPTTSLLREAVFNICAQWLPNAHFLDLFAGSGAMGIEAISRGAAFATLVERDRQALQCIKENVSFLEIETQVQILALDARSAIARLLSPFDLIYIDPPYGYNPMEIVSSIVDRKLLTSQGILFLEERYHAKSAIPTHFHPSLELIASRRYGIAHLHQFRYSAIETKPL